MQNSKFMPLGVDFEDIDAIDSPAPADFRQELAPTSTITGFIPLIPAVGSSTMLLLRRPLPHLRRRDDLAPHAADVKR
jgi:hypothetical protein